MEARISIVPQSRRQPEFHAEVSLQLQVSPSDRFVKKVQLETREALSLEAGVVHSPWLASITLTSEVGQPIAAHRLQELQNGLKVDLTGLQPSRALRYI